MRRRGFLGALAAGALAGWCGSAIALPHAFEERALLSARGVLAIARRRHREEWWEFYRVEDDGREEWVGAVTEQWLAESGRTVEAELRWLAGL